jgi:hypothetical protein
MYIYTHTHTHTYIHTIYTIYILFTYIRASYIYVYIYTIYTIYILFTYIRASGVSDVRVLKKLKTTKKLFKRGLFVDEKRECRS